jgi:hypothetical protein
MITAPIAARPTGFQKPAAGKVVFDQNWRDSSDRLTWNIGGRFF